MREIPLFDRRGNQVATAKVDDGDFARLSAHRWHQGGRGYARRYERIGGKRVVVAMHQSVFGEVPAGMILDHINRDRLDNRRENLRACAHRHNIANQDGHVLQRATPFKGVAVHKKAWRARITVGGRSQHIGCFPSPAEAALAYDRAARGAFGEHARVNFPVGA